MDDCAYFPLIFSLPILAISISVIIVPRLFATSIGTLNKVFQSFGFPATTGLLVTIFRLGTLGFLLLVLFGLFFVMESAACFA